MSTASLARPSWPLVAMIKVVAASMMTALKISNLAVSRRSSVLDVDSYVHANSINMMIVIAIGTALRGIASSVSVQVATLHWPSASWATQALTKVEAAAIS
jgi:hypothetical protein